MKTKRYQVTDSKEHRSGQYVLYSVYKDLKEKFTDTNRSLETISANNFQLKESNKELKLHVSKLVYMNEALQDELEK